MSENMPPEQPPPLQPPSRMSEDEIVALARDIVTNRVYITGDPHAVEISFLVCMLAGVPPQTGLVYEYIERANDRSVNGLPTFFSARFVHFEDCPALVSQIRTFAEALGLPFPPDPQPEEGGGDGG